MDTFTAVLKVEKGRFLTFYYPLYHNVIKKSIYLLILLVKTKNIRKGGNASADIGLLCFLSGIDSLIGKYNASLSYHSVGVLSGIISDSLGVCHSRDNISLSCGECGDEGVVIVVLNG